MICDLRGRQFVCVLFCARALLGAAAENTDVVDTRVRTFITPTRVVWQTGQSEFADGEETEARHYGDRARVENAQALLKAPRGQVPEGGWGVKSPGCLLVNNGMVAGVLLDFGRELHGGLQLGAGVGARGMRVRVRFGESVAEAMCDVGEKGATNDHAIRDDVIELPSFGMREIGNTGFRFVRIDLVTMGSVALEFVRAISLMRPMKRVGAFRCSDERLNRIYETAVRTVHLCCQDYLWDGIKRDRLVWMGDTHPETMGILTTFGAAEILPQSLDLMADITPPNKWMNTLGSYTLWWIRNVAEWYRFTGDKKYLLPKAAYIRATFDNLEKCITPSNTLSSACKPFLDWPTKHNPAAEYAGMQALALMAWRDGAFLAREVGDAALEDRCHRTIARLETLRGTLDPKGSKQAAALLALAGLADAHEMYVHVLGHDGVKNVSTFYGYYMLEAMSAAHEDQHALDTIRDYWGAMLDMGATSFWEDFNIAWTNNAFRIDSLPVRGKKDIHGDYGEFCYTGFRHSLCHGWSCGPAQWCIHHILGIRPKDVACRTIEVKPFLGDLAWAEGVMALPNGKAYHVRVDKQADGSLKITQKRED